MYNLQQNSPMPSSHVQVRGVQVAWQGERHHRQNLDRENECGPNETQFMPVLTVLFSELWNFRSHVLSLPRAKVP